MTRRTHRAALSGLLLLAALLLPRIAQSQLYSWKDADGNVTIKNAPPSWYRQDERVRGPRVQVLREGKVIDDTAWPLEKRLEGRTQAARREVERMQTPEGQLPTVIVPGIPAGKLPGTPQVATPVATQNTPPAVQTPPIPNK